MHKEVILAIFFGTLIGLIFAFGVWKASSTIEKNKDQSNPQASPPSQQQQKPNSSPTQSTLEILSPQEDSVHTEEKTIIQGITHKDATIVISTEEASYIANPQSSGEFEVEIKLLAGLSQVTIFSILDNNIIQKTFSTIYTTEIKADQKEKALLTSFRGTLTDISEQTIQIKSQDGEIKQAETDEDTTFANIQSTTKTLSFSDLAIGDYVLALGTRNGNEILSTQRILVTTPPEETKAKAITGIIESFPSFTITLKDQAKIDASKKPTCFFFSQGKLEKTTLTKIEDDSKIIATGTPDEKDENILVASTIFVLK